MRRALASVLLAAGGATAQLYTTDAGVISPELPTLRPRFEWIVREHADEARATTRWSWSPSRRVQFDLDVPLVARAVGVPAAGGTLRGTQQGLGDVVVGSKWALVRDDEVMRSTRVSLFGDLLLPTGETTTRVDGQDLGPRAGLGLGVAGAALGAGGTWVHDRHRAAVALRAWAYDRDDGFAPGEAVALDLAWWVRLSPREFAPGDPGLELRGVLELLGRWRADDRWRGTDLDDGGHELSFVFGLQANFDPARGLECGLVVPLDATTTSPFGDARYTVTLSLRWSF